MSRVSLASAPAVLEPGSREELAAIVSEHAAAGRPLSPRGRGSGLEYLPRIDPESTAVSSRGLSSIVEYEPADLTATVEAGCCIRDLQAKLRECGQFLPADYPDEGTVGGLVASAGDGPLALGYGGIRDRLLGITVVTAEGAVARAGSRVVKSVAGYDLGKLYCGSFGTLAFIVEVTLKLAPLPERSETLHFAGPPETLDGFVRRALASPFRPSALVLTRDDSGFALGVRVDGSAARLDRLTTELRDMAGTFALGVAGTTRGLPWWRHAGVEIAHPPALTRRVVEALSGEEGELKADPANGRTRFEPSGSVGQELQDELAGLVAGDGWLRIRADGETRWRRTEDAGSAAVVRALKLALDPKDIFNRGLIEALL
ncbi:MAG: FAD-binding oxidoreductase [Dehalococcoidia bacterium]